MSAFLILIIVLVVFFLASAIRILREYERGVIFRLGRVIATKGPGLIILIPVIDKMVKVSLRLVAMDVPSQDVTFREVLTHMLGFTSNPITIMLKKISLQRIQRVS